MSDYKVALPLDPSRREARFLFRAVFFALVGLGIAAGWWTLPWSVYGAMMALALPLYGLAFYALPRWASLCLDVLVFIPLMRYSGGAQSPYVFIVYVWFFGVVLLNARYNKRVPLLLTGGVILGVLGLGAWGSPELLGFLGLHALGVSLSTVLGFNLNMERNQQQTDPLTGVLHRRAGIEKLNDWIAKGRPFSLAFVDFKRFKHINDSYGHAVGDEVVRAVAGRLAARVRKDDIVLRYGGDEFIVASDLLALCPRLEAALLSPINTSAGPITVRIDIGEVKWAPGESLEELLAAADGAMYRKKHHEPGRVTNLTDTEGDGQTGRGAFE